MVEWRNWSGRLSSKPEQLHFLRSEADAQALVKQTSENSSSLRVAGATHSHAPLVTNDGIIAHTDGLSGIISTSERSAGVWGGTRIYALGNALAQHGLALKNQGDIDQQAIAGAVGTGTHGAGRTLKNLSASVTGITLITADGSLVTATPEEQPELWLASRLHLGAFGIVTRLNLNLDPSYRLRESSWQLSLVEALDQYPEQADTHRHFEFFWYPREDQANAKAIDITQDAPEYPLAAEGARCAWSYEVLPNHRPHKHTEMEYSVPAEHAVDCMRDIQDLLSNQFSDVAWPVEFRTLAADDVWLSTAYERETVTISVHQDVRIDETAYYQACEEIFLSYAGRPHWGKVNYLSGQQLGDAHPRWGDWWDARDQIDPKGVFLNEYLASIRP